MRKMLVLLISLIALSTITNAQNQPYPVTAYVSWNPDGTMLAVAYKTYVDIVDASTLNVVNTIPNIVTEAIPAWSPDGNRIALSNSSDLEIWSQPWDGASIQLDMVYQYYDSSYLQLVPIGTIAFSPDGTKIACSHGGGVDIIDSITGERYARLPGEDFKWDIVTDIKWTDDNRLGIANISGWVPIVDANTGLTTSVFVTVDGAGDTGSRALDFSPDGDQLVVGGTQGIVDKWLDTRVVGELVQGQTVRYYGHEDTGSITTFDWSPLGDLIASGDDGGKIRVWDAETGVDSFVIDLGEGAEVDNVAWSPDGTKLAYVDGDGAVQIIDVLDGEEEVD